MSFSYSTRSAWRGPGDLIGANALSGLTSEERMILNSDGSLTLLLEAHLSTRVDLELVRHNSAPLGTRSADYLGEEEGVESIEREVWLTANGERLVYAHLFIPVERAEPWLLGALKEGVEPLGKVLRNREIPVLKEGLQISVIKSEEVCDGLGIDPASMLYARRYRLTNRKESGEWIIKAEIVEVLSPALVKPDE